jgi:hypothetical protein
VRVELETIMVDPHGLKIELARRVEYRSLWKRVIPGVITALVSATVGAAITLVVLNIRPSSPAIVTQFSFVFPEGQHFSNTGRHAVAFSPDGNNVVFSANQQLYLRSMGETEARPIQERPREGKAWTRHFSLRTASG